MPPRRRSPNLNGDKDPRLVEVGARIAEARIRRGISQLELADLVHVSEKTVSMWERGKTRPHRHLNDIAFVLDQPASWFWDGDTVEVEMKELLLQLLEVNKRTLDELRLLRLRVEETGIPS